jgi:ubiquinone/menaquinone biosynthesis C-methylase UbiE
MLLKNLRPAHDYDRFATETLEPWDMLFVARIRQLARDMAPGCLADIGTATAVVPVRLAADAAFAGWRFFGVDLDPTMLEQGRPRIEAQGLAARIELRVGDALALPFDDSALSMVVSRATLHHLPDKTRSLTEMFRVLCPGGIGLVHDMRRDAPAELVERFTRMRAAANYPPTHLDEKVTLDEARRLIAEAGLTAHASVYSPRSGLGSMGFEILLQKPRLA